MPSSLRAGTRWRAFVAIVFLTGCGGAAPHGPATAAGDPIVFEITVTAGGPPRPGGCDVRRTTLHQSGKVVESRCDDAKEVGVVPSSRMSAFYGRARDAEGAKGEPRQCCDMPSVACRVWTRGDLREIDSEKACLDLEELVQGH